MFVARISLLGYIPTTINARLDVSFLFLENRKSIPKMFIGRKLLKNVTLQIWNVIPVS